MAGRPENLTPAAEMAGNVRSLRHGVHSERRIGPRAARQKRAFLRRSGLRLRDLDPVARGLVDLYSRSLAKTQTLDAFFEENGILDEKGRPRPPAQIYFTSINTTRLCLCRLEEHLRKTGIEPSMVASLQAEARRLP